MQKHLAVLVPEISDKTVLLSALVYRVHLWVIRLDTHIHLTGYLRTLLDVSELRRVDQICTSSQQNAFVVLHGCLRQILGHYLRTGPKAIEYIIGQHGKPAVRSPHGALHFNVSHSGAFAVVGVSLCDIGVDIEHLRPVSHIIAIASTFFPRKVASALSQLPQDRRRLAFFKLWTRKEAYVKCSGLGLARTLQAHQSSLCEESAIINSELDARLVQYHDFTVNSDYVGALTYLGPRQEVTFFTYRSPGSLTT